MRFVKLRPGLEPEDVPTGQRRAEIRCPRRHLLGVVTQTEIVAGWREPLSTSRKRIYCTCYTCGESRRAWYWLLDAWKLRAVLKDNPTRRRLNVPIETIARGGPDL